MTSIFELSSRLHYGTIKKGLAPSSCERVERRTSYTAASNKEQLNEQLRQNKKHLRCCRRRLPMFHTPSNNPRMLEKTRRVFKKKQQDVKDNKQQCYMYVCVCAKNLKKSSTEWWQQVQLKYITAEIWHPTTWQKKFTKKMPIKALSQLKNLKVQIIKKGYKATSDTFVHNTQVTLALRLWLLTWWNTFFFAHECWFRKGYAWNKSSQLNPVKVHLRHSKYLPLNATFKYNAHPCTVLQVITQKCCKSPTTLFLHL